LRLPLATRAADLEEIGLEEPGVDYRRSVIPQQCEAEQGTKKRSDNDHSSRMKEEEGRKKKKTTFLPTGRPAGRI
jgi:hypothetical protein